MLLVSHSLVYLFNKYLLGTYDVLYIISGVRKAKMSKSQKGQDVLSTSHVPDALEGNLQPNGGEEGKLPDDCNTVL